MNFPFTTCLFVAASMCAPLWAQSAAPVMAPSMADAAFHTYLASPAFNAVLRDTLSRSCGESTQIRLTALHPVQPVFMGSGLHPREGLWFAVVEAQACGQLQEHRLFFSAREGQPPAIEQRENLRR